MKRFLLLVVVALTFGLLSNSYALPNFWYVGVGSNLSGQLVPSTSVNVKITVKQNGLTVFQEQHNAIMTDDFSIFAVEVGNGTPITGTLGAITMTANTQFICEVSVPPAAFKNIATSSLAYLYSTTVIVPGAISITTNNILMGDGSSNAADVPVGGDLTATYNAGTADFQIAAGAIVNADVNAAAAIDVTKLAAGAANQFLVNNGANAWAGLNLSGNFVGDAVGTALDLSNTGVGAATYGNNTGTAYPYITVDAKGRITSASTVTVVESDPEVQMTTTNAVPVWDGSALVDGNMTDDGVEINLNGLDLNTTGDIYGAKGDFTGNVIAGGTFNGQLQYGVSGTGAITGGPFNNSGNVNLDLTNTGVTAASYGAAGTFPTFTVDAQGRLTAAGTQAETDPVWVAAEPNYANLGQNEVITGNWDNTANPWADNEVANNLTIDGGTVTNSNVTPGTGTVEANAITDGTIVNADVNATAAIDVTKLAAGAANQFLVNNGTNTWAGLSLSGNFTGNAVGTALDLSSTGVAAGSYGAVGTFPTFTVDAKGRLTAAGTQAETDPVWVAAEPNYANLGQNEVITGNWDNTANPWADNEVANNLTINGGTISNSSITVADNVFTLQDNVDNTKQALFELSGITTATTRTYTLPDANGTILLNGDIGVTVQPYNANTTILGSDIDLTSEVTGTLPIANGGTGATTANAALNNLLPSQAGNAGEFLTTDGTDASWAPLTVTLQAAYENNNTITTSLAEGNLIINGTQNVTVSAADGLFVNNNQGAGAAAMLRVENSNPLFNNPVAIFSTTGTSARAAQFLSGSTGYTVKTENTNTGYAITVANTGGGTGLYIDNQSHGGLAIEIENDGGPVKLAFEAPAGDDLGITLTDLNSVFVVTPGTATGNFNVSLPTAVAGKIVFVRNASGFNITLDDVDVTPLADGTGKAFISDGTNWYAL